MNLLQHPELLDQLAASHALGTLRGGARRRFEAIARDSATVRAAALLWQERLASLTELQPADAPSANVWKRIENLIDADRARAASAQPAAVPAHLSESPLLLRLRRALGLWRGAALAGALATVAAMAVGMGLQRDRVQLGEQMAAQQADAQQQRQALLARATQLDAQLRASPAIEYVSVLNDDHASASVLVTYDARAQTLVLRRVGGYRESDSKSLQLWALPPGGAPQSMGVLSADQVIHLNADAGRVGQMEALAISLEPKGGVPSEGGPTGPVLFKGALLKTTT